MSRKVLPMLPWELVDETIEDVKLEVIADRLKNSDTQDDMGSGDEY
jgi:hypothetical protein